MSSVLTNFIIIFKHFNKFRIIEGTWLWYNKKNKAKLFLLRIYVKGLSVNLVWFLLKKSAKINSKNSILLIQIRSLILNNIRVLTPY